MNGSISMIVRGFAAMSVLLAAAGCTPSLHDTVARGELERAERMLARNPDLLESRSDDGKTPLYYAVVNARPDAVEWLLQHGANVQVQKEESGLTPLHVAAVLNRRLEGRHLMSAGADPNAKDIFGNTPLHSAAMHGASQVLNDLLKAGADVNAKNKRGLTPGELAAEYGQPGAKARLAMVTGDTK